MELVGGGVIAPTLAEDTGKSAFHPTVTPLEVTAGVHLNPRNGPVHVALGLGPGIGPGFGTPDLRVYGNATIEFPKAGGGPRGKDEDGDGLYDQFDRCSGTPAGEAIDAAGCSLYQFCDNAGGGKRNLCFFADWQNDEPGGRPPKDCTPHGGTCRPR